LVVVAVVVASVVWVVVVGVVLNSFVNVWKRRFDATTLFATDVRAKHWGARDT
jgi:hypothetical protein